MTAPSGINIPVAEGDRPTNLGNFEIVGAVATALGHRWSSVPSEVWFGQLITSGADDPTGDPGHPRFYLHTEDNSLWFHTEGGNWITVAGSGGGISLTQANAAITAAVHAWARDAGTKIPDGKLPDGIARDAEVTAAIAAGIANWAAAGNSDAIPESKIPASIARDSEVSAQIAASIASHGTGGGLTAGQVQALIADWAETGNSATIPVAKIPGDIARDTEVTTAIAAAILDWAKAGNSATIPVAKLPTIPDSKIPSSIARDSEVLTAIQVWARAGNTTHIPDAKIPVGIARDSEVATAVAGGLTTIRGGVAGARDTLAKLSTAIDGVSAPTAAQVSVAAAGFEGNLDSTITNVQALAQAVDDLVVTSGGGTPTTPQTENIWHGLVAGTVDTEAEINAVVSSLTAEEAPVGGHIVTLGPTASNGQRWVLIVPADHDILTLVNQAVGDDEKDSFTRIVWSTQISGESVISYHTGALRAGAFITYRLTLGA